jgi:hypothetical protein
MGQRGKERNKLREEREGMSEGGKNLASQKRGQEGRRKRNEASERR